MNANPSNPFARLWHLGYKRLVPIVPPGVEVSERSSLFKRIQAGKDDRGKTPGVRWPDGRWSGFDWIPYDADEPDLTRWHSMGAGVGIKTGDLGDGTSLVLIDADTLDEQFAATIKICVEDMLGTLPVRIGKYPKAGYLARIEGTMRYSRVEFGSRANDRGQLLDRVEVLSDGRQFVAEGTHPGTMQAYRWPKDLPALSELPILPEGAIQALLGRLADTLPKASEVKTEGASAEHVDQQALKGDPDMIRRAVEATPNTSDLFPTREAWRDFGYAIKAAMGPENEQEALELFTDWSMRWDDDPKGEGNDAGHVEAEWRRFKPPFKRGAGWLFEQAEEASQGSFSRAQLWFEPPQEPLFPQDENDRLPTKKIAATQFVLPAIQSIPTRQFIYAGHYTRKFVSATVAPSGVGKSSLAIVEALIMVSGKPLLGITPRGQSRVWLWNGEDPRDELDRRIAAAMQHYGLTDADIGDRLFVDSGRDTEIVLATETRDGAKIATPVVDELTRTLLDNRIDVFQADPFVSSHRVSENDNGSIDLVTKQWAKIADRANCAIDLVHHVRKLNGAEITVEDSRGAGSLIATSRSARALTKMTKQEAAKLGLEEYYRRLFRFGDSKNNLAPPASLESRWMALESVGLANGEGSGTDAVLNGDSVGVVTLWDAPDELTAPPVAEETAILNAIRGGSWRLDSRAGDAWVGAAVGQALRLDRYDAADMARIKMTVSSLIKRGVLREVSGKDANRKTRSFVEVVEGLEEECASPENVFL